MLVDFFKLRLLMMTTPLYCLLFWYHDERNWTVQNTTTITKPRREPEEYKEGDLVQAKFQGRAYPAAIIRIKDNKDLLLDDKIKFDELLKKDLNPNEIMEEMGFNNINLEVESNKFREPLPNSNTDQEIPKQSKNKRKNNSKPENNKATDGKPKEKKKKQMPENIKTTDSKTKSIVIAKEEKKKKQMATIEAAKMMAKKITSRPFPDNREETITANKEHASQDQASNYVSVIKDIDADLQLPLPNPQMSNHVPNHVYLQSQRHLNQSHGLIQSVGSTERQESVNFSSPFTNNIFSPSQDQQNHAHNSQNQSRHSEHVQISSCQLYQPSQNFQQPEPQHQFQLPVNRQNNQLEMWNCLTNTDEVLYGGLMNGDHDNASHMTDKTADGHTECQKKYDALERRVNFLEGQLKTLSDEVASNHASSNYAENSSFLSLQSRQNSQDSRRQVCLESVEENQPAAGLSAGIERNQLMIALEPEVASIFCQNLPVDTNSDKKGGFNAGTKYMVVDLGGGTTDITLHEKQVDGSLKELAPATGGSFGGTNVDAAFISFLEEITGLDNLNKLKQESLEDFVDLLREFETKKRSITSNKPGKVTMTLPFSFVSILKKDQSKNGFENAVKISRYAQTVNFKNQKLQIANEMFRSFFQPTIDGIVNIVGDLLSDSKLKDLENILMVGGFSDCELVQNAIREKFGHKRIIVPDEADLAVLKGAVLFGHVPASISSRAARRTYGIQSWPSFDPRTHPIRKKVVIDGVARCKDSFFKYVEIGQDVTPGFQKSQIFQILKPDEESLELTVYWSSNRHPVYIDEPGCHVLGVLRIPVDPTQAGPMEIEETMIFGETEVQIQAKNISTGTVYTENFDFLDEHND